MERKLPHWDMTGIYPSPDSKEFLDDIALLGRIGDEIISETEKEFPSAERLINLKDKGDSLEITLTAYTDALISADSENPVLLRASALAEDASIRYDKADDAYIRCIDEKADISSVPERFRYSISRIKKIAGHLMTSDEESLASELSKTGEKAWEKLMESVTSVAADDGMTLTSLRAEAMNPDREKRESAYRRELKLLETHKTAIAAALNGVKGTVLTLEKRRGWDDPIERSLFSSAISKKTLEALLSAMEDSLPMFRRYFNLKARMLGLDKLSFFDLFAPVGSGSRSYSFEEAMNLVIEEAKINTIALFAYNITSSNALYKVGSIPKFLPLILDILDSIVNKLQSGNDKEAFMYAEKFSRIVSYVFNILSNVAALYSIDYSQISIDSVSLSDAINDFNEMMNNVLEAFSNEDYISIADLLEYEIKERIENIMNYIPLVEEYIEKLNV